MKTKKTILRSLAPLLIFTFLMLFAFANLTFAQDATQDSTSEKAANTDDDQVDATAEDSDDSTQDEAEVEAEVEAEDDTQNDDSTLRRPHIRKGFDDIYELPKGKASDRSFYVLLQWGYIDKVVENASELNWSIAVSMANGKVDMVNKPILFEGNDKINEQSAPSSLTGITQTRSHWDGIIVKVTPYDASADDNITLTMGSFERTYKMSELFLTNGIYELTDGHQVAVRSFRRGGDLSTERREDLFNRKLEILKRIHTIDAKVKELIELGQISDEMARHIFQVLSRLVNYEYTSEQSVKWLVRVNNFLTKIQKGRSKDLRSNLDELNKEFDQDCSVNAPDDFKEGIVPFADTSQCAWYTDSIRRLRSANVVQGMKGTDNFAPANNITRAELLAIVLKASGINVDQEADSRIAADVAEDSRGHWAERGIGYALKQGLIKGYDDGFRPNNFVTRAEALAMVFRVFGLSADEPCPATFTDSDGHWAQCIIEDAKLFGIVKGFEDNTFRPNEPITRAAMATIISTTVDYIKVQGTYEEL